MNCPNRLLIYKLDNPTPMNSTVVQSLKELDRKTLILRSLGVYISKLHHISRLNKETIYES